MITLVPATSCDGVLSKASIWRQRDGPSTETALSTGFSFPCIRRLESYTSHKRTSSSWLAAISNDVLGIVMITLGKFSLDIAQLRLMATPLPDT